MLVRSAADLANVIRAQRRHLGWTQSRLAEAAGVSRWWVTEFEAGKARAELDLVLRTIDALDLLIDVSQIGVADSGDTLAADRTLAPAIDLDQILAEHTDLGDSP